jgi:hypothetical protein
LASAFEQIVSKSAFQQKRAAAGDGRRAGFQYAQSKSCVRTHENNLPNGQLA